MMERLRTPCTPQERQYCPLKRHFYDIHHKYFPSNLYKTPLETEFRELEENKELMCYYQHHFEIHGSEEQTPNKPKVSEMLEAVMRIEE